MLPPVAVGEALDCRELQSKSHTTQPPNRYSEASLTRALEEMGIGRPSTYASIIDTILARDYVFKAKRGNVLVPTWTAFAVSQLLEAHLPDLVDYQFTAEMEDELDAISRGELDSPGVPPPLLFRQGREGAQGPGREQDRRDRRPRRLPRARSAKPEGQPEVFVPRGPLRAVPGAGRAAGEHSRADAARRIDAGGRAEDAGDVDAERRAAGPRPGRQARLPQGGPLRTLRAARRRPTDEEKPQNASLLKGMQPEDVTIDVALKLLSLPRTLGQHPASGQPVVAYNGRYGPVREVRHARPARCRPGLSPLDVTFEQAMELLAQPKTTGRGRGAVKREPLKVFEASPVTNNPVQLLAGRYGPYVTDGVTNASLPRGTAPEEVTLEYALNLSRPGPSRGRRSPPAAGRESRRAPKKTSLRRRRRRRPRKNGRRRRPKNRAEPAESARITYICAA